MRLKPAELNAIRLNVRSSDPDGQLYLYGSRADDDWRGGDIDLIIKTPDQAEQPIYQIARKGIRL